MSILLLTNGETLKVSGPESLQPSKDISKYRLYFILLYILFFLNTSSLAATVNDNIADLSATEPVNSDQIAIENDLLFDDLLKELEDVTAIATRTKLNIDYVPGMVTILHGADMQKQGIHSLQEALATVPGVEVTISNNGEATYVMRGIGKSFSSGKVKFLVNGRSMNIAMSASATATLIPMQLVERIEVIRGPGSAIYGEYAYAGVVNIITRTDSSLFYTGSTHSKNTVGGSWSNFRTDSPVKYSFGFSVYDAEGKQVNSGKDFLTVIETPIAEATTILNRISNSPGYSNEAERVFITNIQFLYKNFKWDTFVQHQQVGDYFGFRNALPPEVNFNRKRITAATNLDRKITVNDTLSGLATVGLRYHSLRSNSLVFFPAGFPVANPITGFPTDERFDDGIIGGPNYTETEIHGGLEFNYSGLKHHNVLFGVFGVSIKQGDTWAVRNSEILENVNLIGQVPSQEFRGDENWLTEKNTRKIGSVYAQDQWHVVDSLTITLGGRFDHYFQRGSSFNNRLAAVYTPHDRHIFKIQYSEAFRPPTFLELYAQNNLVAIGNINIKPETIKSLEGGYIYRNSSIGTHLRITLFYSRLNDLITYDETKKYENLGNTISQGIELEFEKTIKNNLTFNSNITYADIYNNASSEKLPNVASIYGNAKIVYQPLKQVTLTLSDQYIGKRKREIGDPRSSLDAYQVLNGTLSLRHASLNNMTVSVGIKNIFDQKVSHPAPLTSFGPANIVIPSYANDYPRPGREFWLNVFYTY